MLTGLVCVHCRCTSRLYTSREADKFLTFLHPQGPQYCRTGVSYRGCLELRNSSLSAAKYCSRSTLHLWEEELVQLLPFTFAGFVHTSAVPGEGVQLHPLAVHQLTLQGGHQQGPGTIYNANVVLIAEAKRLTTNANIYSINLHYILASLSWLHFPPRPPAVPCNRAATQSSSFRLRPLTNFFDPTAGFI